MFTDRGEEFLPYIQGTTDEPMPLYVKPNRKISVQDVKNAMRDTTKARCSTSRKTSVPALTTLPTGSHHWSLK